jgi:hypothetical protein
VLAEWLKPCPCRSDLCGVSEFRGTDVEPQRLKPPELSAEIAAVTLGDLIEPADTWNPANAAPGEVFNYIDLSAVDQDAKLIQRRTTRIQIGVTEINKEIVERFYQERAIRRIGEAFEKDHERKALVVMASCEKR